MGQIVNTFKNLQRNNKKAFIIYLTFGFPSIRATEEIILSLQNTAVDVIEVGLPFSDPLADGPILEEAAHTALKNGVNTNIFFKNIRSIKNKIRTPLVIMTYYNPVFCYGVDRFIKKAYNSGISGIMVVDLPLEESRDFIHKCREFDLDTVFFITPQTTKKRMKEILKVSRGFVYYISVTGITGPRDLSFEPIRRDISYIKRIEDIPVCVGFGIHSKRQVKSLLKISDGFIVGSAFARFIKGSYRNKDFPKKIKEFIRRIYV